MDEINGGKSMSKYLYGNRIGVSASRCRGDFDERWRCHGPTHPYLRYQTWMPLRVS